MAHMRAVRPEDFHEVFQSNEPWNGTPNEVQKVFLTNLFKDIGTAYGVLGDEGKRELYDTDKLQIHDDTIVAEYDNEYYNRLHGKRSLIAKALAVLKLLTSWIYDSAYSSCVSILFVFVILPVALFLPSKIRPESIRIFDVDLLAIAANLPMLTKVLVSFVYISLACAILIDASLVAVLGMFISMWLMYFLVSIARLAPLSINTIAYKAAVISIYEKLDEHNFQVALIAGVFFLALLILAVLFLPLWLQQVIVVLASS